jgi:hypothetical protein
MLHLGVPHFYGDKFATNLKTAKPIGVTIQQSVLFRADKIIR